MKDLAEKIKKLIEHLSDEQIDEINKYLGEKSIIRPLDTCGPGYYRNSKGVCVLDPGQP